MRHLEAAIPMPQHAGDQARIHRIVLNNKDSFVAPGHAERESADRLFGASKFRDNAGR
jgi:hypothetical protein